MEEFLKFLITNLKNEYMPRLYEVEMSDHALLLSVDSDKQEPWILAASEKPGLIIYVNGIKV